MGEIAEMMLDGTLCEGCGAYLPGEGQGVPRRCSECRHETNLPDEKVPCPTCGKRVKRIGMKDHCRDAHQQGNRK